MSQIWNEWLKGTVEFFPNEHSRTFQICQDKLLKPPKGEPSKEPLLGKDFLAKPKPEDTESSQKVAWRLHIELRSRITTQPLRFDHGDEVTALKSVHSLFGTLRNILIECGPQASDFAHVSMNILNGIVRPFTAFWHRKVKDGTFQRRDMKHRFRRELLDLQNDMRYWAVIAGRLAEAPLSPTSRTSDSTDNPSSVSVERYIVPPDLLPQQQSSSHIMNGPVKPDLLIPPGFGDSNDKSNDKSNAVEISGEITKAEQAEIKKRRGSDSTSKDADELVGLAISGGGIRSATFAQGVLQTLAQKKMLDSVDYLSTVSGGGYLGAFWSSGGSFGFETPQSPEAKPSSEAPKRPETKPSSITLQESASLRHIRNHAKYIRPNSVLEWVQIVGSILHGISLNVLVLIPLVIWSFAAVKVVADWSSGAVWILFYMVCCAAAILTFLLPIVQSFWSKGHRFRKGYGTCLSGFLLLVGGLTLWLGLQKLYTHPSSTWIYEWVDWKALLFLIPSLLLLRLMLLLKVPGKLIFQGFLLVCGLFFYLGSFVLLAKYFGWEKSRLLFLSVPVLCCELWIPYELIWCYILFGSVIFLVYLFVVMNINETSLHKFYRQFLSKTYIGVGSNSSNPNENTPPPKLSALEIKAPYHLINTTINLQGSKCPSLRGRDADFFVLSKCYVGSSITGYVKTEILESYDKHLDLATAMAISGAAVAPNMGTTTQSNLVFLMTALNLRLGYWFRNPAAIHQQSTQNAKPWRFPRLDYLFREYFSRIHENSNYVNLSDGGHIENLGLYELLRRKCKYIISIDGEADPNMECGSLMKVMRYAEIDFGIKIDIDIDDLRKNHAGFSQMHTAMGLIDYGSEETGALLYIKSSLTGNEPLYVLNYHKQHPKFPQQSTGDQFFDEEQFEAYRALGEHIGKTLFQPEFLGQTEPQHSQSIPQWFDKLANALIPLDRLKNKSKKSKENRDGL